VFTVVLDAVDVLVGEGGITGLCAYVRVHHVKLLCLSLALALAANPSHAPAASTSCHRFNRMTVYVCVSAETLDWLPSANALPANLRLILACRADVSRNSAGAMLQRKGYNVKPVPRLQDVDPSALLSALLLRRGVQLSEATLASVLTKRCSKALLATFCFA
jgi:hypothetical protein